MEKTSLHDKKEALKKELRAITAIEESEIAKIHYPKFKEKYEGKFFKQGNGYSQGKRWTMYTKVVEISKKDIYDTGGNGITSHFKGWLFQVDCYGSINIDQITHGYVHSLGKEITESEFNAAWNNMVAKMNQLK